MSTAERTTKEGKETEIRESCAITPRVFRTEGGVPYLQEPGIVVLAVPSLSLELARTFLEGVDQSFSDYVDDTTVLTDGTQLAKFAGQLCYMSFGARRTKNERAKMYFDNIKRSGHGSVLEHVNYSLLLYGISRATTHEIVRHRTFSYSQVSTRYVSADVMRFVERDEFRRSESLHTAFLERIERVHGEYKDLAAKLRDMRESGTEGFASPSKRDARKRVQQLARMVLSHEVEAPMVMTGNVRSWRHFIEMRANEHADVEIRILAHGIYTLLKRFDPVLFDDYDVVELEDGTKALRTEFRKV